MALATLHLAAIPVAAGLLVGSGAIATFMTGQSNPMVVSTAISAPASATVPSAPPCVAQTWPYLDQTCMATARSDKRAVRLVAAPRSGEASDSNSGAVSSTASAASARAAEPSLTTSDTVLRQPQQLATKTIEPQAAKARTRGETRRQRSERRWSGQTYRVTSEFDGRRTAPVTVMRPLRLESFR
jgi:hypothetical protein